MSDTPRTDANAHFFVWNPEEALNEFVTAAFSRELERENAALRAALEQIRLAWTTQAEACSDHSDLAFRMAQYAFNTKAIVDAERKDNNK